MLNTVRSCRGMVTAPHHLASEAGLRVLRDGGNAIEATIAMAAALSVVYPHMTGIGGDGFWLVAGPGERPVGIEACGRAARAATPEHYLAQGYQTIPTRGPLAANTVAATMSGWEVALTLSAQRGGRLSLARLLEDAIHHAHHGFPVTASQADLTLAKLHELQRVPGFSETFLIDGKVPATGALISCRRLPRLFGRSPAAVRTTSIAASFQRRSPPTCARPARCLMRMTLPAARRVWSIHCPSISLAAVSTISPHRHRACRR